MKTILATVAVAGLLVAVALLAGCTAPQVVSVFSSRMTIIMGGTNSVAQTIEGGGQPTTTATVPLTK